MVRHLAGMQGSAVQRAARLLRTSCRCAMHAREPSQKPGLQIVQSAEEVRVKAEGSVAKAESRAMALQQQLVLLQLRLQEQGQLIRESTHQEARLESQLQEIRMELKVTETREHELRALAAELEVRGMMCLSVGTVNAQCPRICCIAAHVHCCADSLHPIGDHKPWTYHDPASTLA